MKGVVFSSAMIRPANLTDVPAIARVHVDSWRTTYQGIVPDSFLEQMTYASYEARWQNWLKVKVNYHHIFVAENAVGEVIGFANGGAERTKHSSYGAELYAIYVLQAYQRQGHGRRLVRAIATLLVQSGFSSMLVWALVDNPACRFYQALGGQPLKQQILNIGGKDLIEIAYGWANLEDLLTLLHSPAMDRDRVIHDEVMDDRTAYDRTAHDRTA